RRERLELHEAGEHGLVADLVLEHEGRALRDLMREKFLRARRDACAHLGRLGAGLEFLRIEFLAAGFRGERDGDVQAQDLRALAPSASAAVDSARRISSPSKPKSRAASATRFDATITPSWILSGSNQPELSMNGERTTMPLRR